MSLDEHGRQELLASWNSAKRIAAQAVELADEGAIGRFNRPTGRGFHLSPMDTNVGGRASAELLLAVGADPTRVFAEAKQLVTIAERELAAASLVADAKRASRATREVMQEHARAALWRAVDARGMLEVLKEQDDVARAAEQNGGNNA